MTTDVVEVGVKTDTEPASESPTVPKWRRMLGAAARAETGVWVSIWRFLTRQPRVPAGATGFHYHAPILTILIIFIVLTAVEIPIFDLIVHRWPWVRIPLLIAGIWGLIWMLGFLFGFLTRPHAVGPEGIRARYGAEIDVDLPWSAVASVERSRDVKEKAPKIGDEPHGRTLSLRMNNETNILVLLEQPVDAQISGETTTIDAVRLWADDVDGFLSAVRTHIP